MTEWSNPYNVIQRSVRTALKDRLRRTNGRVCRGDLLACADAAHRARAEKLVLRLCRVCPDGMLEWKPEIVSIETLRQKLGGTKAVDAERLQFLWSQSRTLAERTTYPYLAPAANKSQLVSRTNFREPPVFGIDFLVRPPTEFSEDRDEEETRNALSLGAECLALVIHGQFDDGCLSDDGDFFARVVVGDELAIPKVVAQIPSVAIRCEMAMIPSLYAGDVEAAVDAALPHLHDFARSTAMAFVS
jgi:hypothetical protein